MNQENVQTNVEQMIHRLQTKVEKLGYGTGHNDYIADMIMQGVAEFKSGENILFGKDNLFYELKFGLLPKRENQPEQADNGYKIYLLSTEGVLQKDIKIPIVEGFNIGQLETHLSLTPQQQATFINYKDDIENKMLLLMEQKPELFNALYVKYRPALEFTIPDELKKQQQELLSNHVVSNAFSSYFNLTPMEIYNLLHGRSVDKDLFLTNKKEEAKQTTVTPEAPDEKQNQKSTFNTWLKVNFDSPVKEGAHEMTFISSANFNIRKVLKQYNFEELATSYGKMQMEYHLKKGSQFLVHNLNKEGEKELLIEAAPEFKDINLRKMTGEPIFNRNLYYKEPLVKEVTEFVQLKKNDGAQYNQRHYPGQRVIAPGYEGQKISR